MNWLSFFSKNENITAEQAREFMDSRPPGSFQLLDVRQPKEYRKGHIAGAIFIPLGDLEKRHEEMNPDLETLVYCHSGVRSRAACQILSTNSFPSVRNMLGGIVKWQGHQASGDESLGLDYFVRGEFSSVFSMAYAMEAGLKQFYTLMAQQATDPECVDLLEYFAKLEDGHMAKLKAKYPNQENGTATPDTAIAEGGFDTSEFIDRFGHQVNDIQSIIEMGMMFEAQAYDMYSRLVRKQDKQEIQSFFLQMATEEQRHLELLTKELEQRI